VLIKHELAEGCPTRSPYTGGELMCGYVQRSRDAPAARERASTAARRSAPLAWSDSKPTFCSKYAIPDGGGHYRAVRHPMASARCDV